MIRHSYATVTVSGTTGTATTRDTISGLIDGIYIDYDAAAPATVDAVVKEANLPYPQTIYSKADYRTDGWAYPRKALVNGADGSALTGPVDFYNVNDQIKVTISQATDGQVYVVDIQWDDLQ